MSIISTWGRLSTLLGLFPMSGTGKGARGSNCAATEAMAAYTDDNDRASVFPSGDDEDIMGATLDCVVVKLYTSWLVGDYKYEDGRGKVK